MPYSAKRGYSGPDTKARGVREEKAFCTLSEQIVQPAGQAKYLAALVEDRPMTVATTTDSGVRARQLSARLGKTAGC